jgi:hypothetical protein
VLVLVLAAGAANSKPLVLKTCADVVCKWSQIQQAAQAHSTRPRRKVSTASEF